ncbi:MAG: hypothetical protein FJX73_10765 [Armatimonadetes bacterium]|nr:hypothetical protein [Armatimonadota bacterium]
MRRSRRPPSGGDTLAHLCPTLGSLPRRNRGESLKEPRPHRAQDRLAPPDLELHNIRRVDAEAVAAPG